MSSQGEGVASKARAWLGRTFGVRGRGNVAAWAVAGVAAYVLFYAPEKQRQDDIKVCVCVFGCAGVRPE